MSLHSYERSRELAARDEPFSAYIMAAMRKADTGNSRRLRAAFPEIDQELYERYWCPGGLTVAEGGNLDDAPTYEEFRRNTL